MLGANKVVVIGLHITWGLCLFDSNMPGMFQQALAWSKTCATILACAASILMPFALLIAPTCLAPIVTRWWHKAWQVDIRLKERQRLLTAIICKPLPRDVSCKILKDVMDYADYLRRRKVWWHMLGWLVFLIAIQGVVIGAVFALGNVLHSQRMAAELAGLGPRTACTIAPLSGSCPCNTLAASTAGSLGALEDKILLA